MPRIPYVSDDCGPEDLVAPLKARRGGKLLNLDRQLLHSPPLARGWNALMGQVRGEFALPARLRELAICAVAALNRAPYEMHHHAPLFLREGGSEAQLAALDDVAAASRDTGRFDAAERAVLALTFEMTRNVEVGDATFAALRRVLPDERQVVEAVAVVASYNMVSRVLVALGVEPE